jgi:hypothetical protein
LLRLSLFTNRNYSPITGSRSWLDSNLCTNRDIFKVIRPVASHLQSKEHASTQDFDLIGRLPMVIDSLMLSAGTISICVSHKVYAIGTKRLLATFFYIIRPLLSVALDVTLEGASTLVVILESAFVGYVAVLVSSIPSSSTLLLPWWYSVCSF